MKAIKQLTIFLLIPVLIACKEGEMTDEGAAAVPSSSSSTCFHTLQETRYTDVSGDGTNDQIVTISYNYDLQTNTTKRIEDWDTNADSSTDDRITISYSLFNTMGDYEKKVTETDLGLDQVIDSSEDSTYVYDYDINAKLIERIESRKESANPNVLKTVTYVPIYDATGDKSTYRYDIDSTSDGIIDNTQSYDVSYDILGKQIAKIYRYNNSLRYSISYINTYNSNLLTRVLWEQHSWDKNAVDLGFIYGVTDSTYDSYQDLITEETREYSDSSRDTISLIYRREKVRDNCSVLVPAQ